MNLNKTPRIAASRPRVFEGFLALMSAFLPVWRSVLAVISGKTAISDKSDHLTPFFGVVNIGGRSCRPACVVRGMSPAFAYARLGGACRASALRGNAPRRKSQGT